MTHEENNMDPKSITNLTNDAVDGKNVLGGNYALGDIEGTSHAGDNSNLPVNVEPLSPMEDPLGSAPGNGMGGPYDEPGNPNNNPFGNNSPLDAHKGPSIA